MSRLFVGGLNDNVDRRDLEREFRVYGDVEDCFVARNPPGFAFIVYKKSREAEKAIYELDGATVCGSKVRVEHARPRGAGRGGGGGRSMSDIKCYNCGKMGHMSRDCGGRSATYGYSSRARSRSRSPRSRSRSRSTDRDRDRRKRRSPSKSRSRSRSRDRTSRRRYDDERSESRSRGDDRSRRKQSPEKRERSRHSETPVDRSQRTRSPDDKSPIGERRKRSKYSSTPDIGSRRTRSPEKKSPVKRQRSRHSSTPEYSRQSPDGQQKRHRRTPSPIIELPEVTETPKPRNWADSSHGEVDYNAKLQFDTPSERGG